MGAFVTGIVGGVVGVLDGRRVGASGRDVDGRGDGVEVGADDGVLVGMRVGMRVGLVATLGDVGLALGARIDVGTVEGVHVGAALGMHVGAALGID